MRIVSLDIYAYGKLSNVHVELQDLSLIYGENEAGKSTMMSFIQSVLFGFPTKQQSELRYEPRGDSRYGGRLTVQTSRFGEASIERVRGRMAAGEVRVLLSDGTTGGEELLSKLLDGMNKAMFTGVFSFNVQSLQHIQRLTGEEVGRYLLAAGTVGTDALIKAELTFSKEMERLYKPNGRKPKLNELLSRLRSEEKALKQGKLLNGRYAELKSTSLDVEQQAQSLELEEKQLRDDLQRMEELRKAWPLLEEVRNLENITSASNVSSFPAEGLKRLERLRSRHSEITSRLKAIEASRDQAVEKLNKFRSASDWEKLEPAVETAAASLQSRTERINRQTGMEKDLAETIRRITSLAEELNVEPDKWMQTKPNLGMDQREKLRQLLRNLYELELSLQKIHTELAHEKDKELELESRLSPLEEELMPEREFRELQRAAESSLETESLRHRHREIKEKLSLLELAGGNKTASVMGSRSSMIIFVLLFFGLFIWAVLSGQWVIAVLSGAGTAFGVIMAVGLHSQNSGTAGADIQTLKEELAKLEFQLAGSLKSGKGEEFRLARQLELRNAWKQAFMQLEQQRQKSVLLEERCCEAEKEREHIASGLAAMKLQIGLAVDFSAGRLEDAFDYLRELADLLGREKQLHEDIACLKQEEEDWMERVRVLAQGAGITFSSPEETVHALKQWVRSQREKKILQREWSGKLEVLADEARPLEFEADQLQQEMSNLFRQASAKDEEEFRAAAYDYAYRAEAGERLALLKRQLGSRLLESSRAFNSMDDVEEALGEISRAAEVRSLKLKEVRDRRASIQYELKMLEEGGTYTEQLHRFYQIRSDFQAESKKWAAYAAAKQLLSKTMDRLKNERFPAVVRQAEYYFRQLTEGEYTGLLIQPDGGEIVVQRRDQVTFAPKELSKGTGEQLYTAIRLALVRELKADYPFPVIIDDAFVNFDWQRSKLTATLLKEISRTTQVLIYTCHPYMLDLFPESRPIQLSAGSIKTGAE